MAQSTYTTKQLGYAVLPPGQAQTIYTVPSATTTLTNEILISNWSLATQFATKFNTPSAAWQMASGDIYVTDRNNHRIRKIGIDGTVSTFYGSGAGADLAGTGTAGQIYAPTDICSDGTNLYVTTFGNHVMQIVIGSGVGTIIAGTGGTAETGASNATGTSAIINAPLGIATDGTNLYACSSSGRIWKIVLSGSYSTSVLAGSGANADTAGTGTAAAFYTPYGICITSDNLTLYVVTQSGNHIGKIVISSGVVTFPTTCPPSSASITIDSTSRWIYTTEGSSGNLITRTDLNNVSDQYTIAGSTSGNVDGWGTTVNSMSFPTVNFLHITANNHVLFTRGNAGHQVCVMTSDGYVKTIAGQSASSGMVNGTINSQAQQVNVHLVASGGSILPSNMLTPYLTINAGEMARIPLGAELPVGTEIVLMAPGGGCTAWVSGVEVQ